MKAVSVTANSAIIVWDAPTNENVTHYVVRNCRNPTFNLCTSSNRSTYCEISTTNACSVCCYYVESYANEVYLGESTAVHAATLPPPPCISSISATYRTAIVNWSICHGAQKYYLGYRRSGSQTWTIVETPRTSITIPNLLLSNTYQFKVQCEDTIGKSSFSSTKNFTLQGIIPNTCKHIHS